MLASLVRTDCRPQAFALTAQLEWRTWPTRSSINTLSVSASLARVRAFALRASACARGQAAVWMCIDPQVVYPKLPPRFGFIKPALPHTNDDGWSQLGRDSSARFLFKNLSNGAFFFSKLLRIQPDVSSRVLCGQSLIPNFEFSLSSQVSQQDERRRGTDGDGPASIRVLTARACIGQRYPHTHSHRTSTQTHTALGGRSRTDSVYCCP